MSSVRMSDPCTCSWGAPHGDPCAKPVVEKNKRLAQTRLPGGKLVEREWTAHERYMLYASGFKDGAGVRPIDKEREGLGAYDRGYADGRLARSNAIASYANEVGYRPTILRAADDRSKA
jgi:hypothetical protein